MNEKIAACGPTVKHEQIMHAVQRLDQILDHAKQVLNRITGPVPEDGGGVNLCGALQITRCRKSWGAPRP